MMNNSQAMILLILTLEEASSAFQVHQLTTRRHCTLRREQNIHSKGKHSKQKKNLEQFKAVSPRQMLMTKSWNGKAFAGAETPCFSGQLGIPREATTDFTSYLSAEKIHHFDKHSCN